MRHPAPRAVRRAPSVHDTRCLRSPRTAGRGLALVLSLLLAACASNSQQHQLTESHLRERLAEFTDLFSSAIQRASDEVVATTRTQETRRNLLRWQMYMVPACRHAAAGDDPLEAFVDVWTLCVQQQLFFDSMSATAKTEGEKAVCEVGRRTSALLVQEAESIGVGFLTPEQLVQARKDVTDFAHANPIDSRYTRLARLPSEVQGTGSASSFAWLDNIPLIGAFSGLDQGAKALEHLAQVAEQFTRIAEQLPEAMRWQTSLVLYELDDLESVDEIVKAADAMADAADRMAGAAESLPANAGQLVRTSFAELEASQASLQATLEQARSAVTETRGTITALDGTVDRTQALLTALDAAAASVTRAGAAWEAMVRSLDDDKSSAAEPGTSGGTGTVAEGAPGQEADGAAAPAAHDTAAQAAGATHAGAEASSEGSFDPVPYGKAADSLAAAAVEIRALVEDVRATANSDDLLKPLDAADGRARDLVDHAALRGLQLIGAGLLAALLYRFAVRRRAAP